MIINSINVYNIDKEGYLPRYREEINKLQQQSNKSISSNSINKNKNNNQEANADVAEEEDGNSYMQ